MAASSAESLEMYGSAFGRWSLRARDTAGNDSPSGVWSAASRYFGAGALLAACYFAAAQLGLIFAIPPGCATAVWPPSGIALAALLVLGCRHWPAIWIGALLTNLTTGVSVATAAGFATGNSLEALVAAWLFRRLLPKCPFQRTQDAFLFVSVAVVSCLLAATVGATSLFWAGYIRGPQFGDNWWTWWLGDLAGQLIVVPMLLAVAQQRWSSWEGLRSAELLLSFGLQVGLSLLLFGGWLPERIAEHLLYLPMVLLIWLCVRFSLAEVAAGTVVFSVAAVWGTSRGLGAYRTEALQSLFDLQILLNTYAVTGLVLSSITIGRRASETAARRAADELRKERAERSRAETWFQQLLAASPDALVVANDQGRIVLANEAAERLLGYARDELTGQPVELLVPLSLRERHQAHRDRYHASPHVRLMGTGVELVARRKDGTEFPAEIALGPMQSAEGLFVFSAIRDITARKRAQEIIVRREAQLVAAEQIQQRLLPQHTPHVPGLDIAGRCYPAESAAGDYFDYLRLPDESFLAVTGDVAGHGIGPAILMAWLHAYIRLLSETYTDLAELVTRANVALLERTGADRFVTLIAGRFDPRSGTLTYLNAGHPSGYVVDRAGRVKHVLESTGLPLAIDVDTRFVLGPTVELGDGDTVVFLTDGVLEAAPTTRRQFGTEACLGVVRASLDQGAAEIVERLYVAACQHAGRERLEDDVTIVVVKVSADFRRSETAGPDTRRLDTTPPLRDNAVVTGVGPGEHDMAMQSSDEDVLVVALSAEPELNEELKDTVSVVLNRSRCDVVMNLANVGLVTSSSLSALLRLKKLQKDRGRRLVLCHVSRTTRKIFEATGIEGLFEFAADQEEALASVQAGRNKLGLFPAGDESLPS